MFLKSLTLLLLSRPSTSYLCLSLSFSSDRYRKQRDAISSSEILNPNTEKQLKKYVTVPDKALPAGLHMLMLILAHALFFLAIAVQGFSHLIPLPQYSTSTTRMMMQRQEELPKSVADSESLEDIYMRIKNDGKWIPKVSTSTFLLTLGVGVPIWMSILLPMSMVYQLGKSIFPSSKKTEEKLLSAAVAEEIETESDFNCNIIPLNDRKYDLVLFGATGFTGKIAAMYLCQQYGGKEDGSKTLAHFDER